LFEIQPKNINFDQNPQIFLTILSANPQIFFAILSANPQILIGYFCNTLILIDITNYQLIYQQKKQILFNFAKKE
jgi:hypothetical protein